MKLSIYKLLESILNPFEPEDNTTVSAQRSKTPPDFVKQLIDKYTQSGWNDAISGNPPILNPNPDARGFEQLAMKAYQQAFSSGNSMKKKSRGIK